MEMRSIVYSDREIEGEQLELTAKEGHYALGPNLTLRRRCTVVLKVSARWLHIRPARFIDCTFEVKQELVEHDWWVPPASRTRRVKGGRASLPGAANATVTR